MGYRYINVLLICFTYITIINAHCSYKKTKFDMSLKNTASFENNYLECNYIPTYPETIINNYKKETFNYNDMTFSSACVRCLLCLTIARELNKVLILFHKTNPPKMISRSENINKTLNTFCNSGFKNFDLREEKGLRFLEKHSKNSKHVPCGSEGLWPRKLKEMCTLFMEESGEWFLYLRWFAEVQDVNFDMTRFLCRSYGLFQHCRNLPLNLKSENQQSKLKLFCFR